MILNHVSVYLFTNVSRETKKGVSEMFENLPYTNFHELNLDWLLKTVKNNAMDIIKLKNAIPTEKETNKYDNVLLLGDSYANGTTGNGAVYTNSYALQLEGLLRRHYGSTVYRYSIGGAGFLTETENNSFSVMAEKISENITDTSQIDTILILGGCNDIYYTYEALKTRISNTLGKIKKLYPNASIHVGCIGNYNDSRRQTMRKVVIPGYKTCVDSNVKYITDSELFLVNIGLFYEDNTHPTQEGQNAIATGLYNYLINGTVTLTAFEKFYDLSNSDKWKVNDKLRLIVSSSDNNIGAWIIQQSNLRADAFSISPTSDTNNVLLNQTFAIARFNLNSKCTENTSAFPSSLAVASANIILKSYSQMQVPCVLHFIDGALKCTIFATSGSSVVNSDNVIRIEFRGATWHNEGLIGI